MRRSNSKNRGENRREKRRSEKMWNGEKSEEIKRERFGLNKEKS
jgi:hypothetical protein